MMMSSTIAVLAIFLVVCQVSFAIILRPKWYPYFPKHDEVPVENTYRSDFAALTDTMSSREARTAADFVPLCNQYLTTEQCLSKIVLIISRILQHEIRKDLF